ncbi:MAG: tRNA epoxyqueuosine(34) reductase QueG [Opitutaceae bacterium]|nr:tRNA epoxyqueuosine(34) reductase QueG [Opitutaceae bacterium]
MNLKEELRGRLLGIGFDVVRFASVERIGGEGLKRWIDAGHQGEMDWMKRSVDKRLDPRAVLEGASSLILLGVNYLPQGDEEGEAQWARYARYEDYHDTIKPGLVNAGRIIEELFHLGASDYRYYVDTGPVLEREWAGRSGLGFIGKSAMLISRDYGNWLFLAAILVRAEIEPDPPLKAPVSGPGGLCGKCTRCLEACPTDAFVGPGWLDARRCISYLTIENKGVIPREFRRAIGDRVYGCDVCAEVCPWNRFAQEARSVLLKPKTEFTRLSLAELLRLDAHSFAERFRGTPIKRIKLAGMLRNACVVAGNSGRTELVPLLLRLCLHEVPLVRAHAVWAVRQLKPGEWRSLLAEQLTNESDPIVRAEIVDTDAAP